MKTPTTHNKNGEVTNYGFACGYKQSYKKEIKGTDFYLYFEHGVYSIAGFINGEHFLKPFVKLTEARAEFKQLIKQASN